MIRRLFLPVLFLLSFLPLPAQDHKNEDPQSLSDLVDLALSRNPATKASWASAREAGSRVEMAKADYFPKLELQAEAMAQDVSQQDYPSTTEFREYLSGAGVELSYLLFDFGGKGARLSAAKAGYAATLRRYDRILQDVVLEVQTAYFIHAAAKEALREAEAFYELEQWNNRSAQSASGYGLASENNVLAATETLRRAEFQLTKAKALCAQTLGRLNVAIGQPAQSALNIQPLSPKNSLPPIELRSNELIALALANRPDLAEKVALWQARVAESRAARADIWPKIYLEALAQQGWARSKSIDNSVPAPSYRESGDSLHNYGVGIGFSWDFFDGFYKQNKAKAAQAAVDQAEALLQSARLGTSREVWDAWQNTRVEMQNVEFWKAGLDRANLDFSKAELAARTGLASEIDLLRAKAQLAAVRASATRARAEWLTATAQLLHAVGQVRPQGNPATN